jgi:hypothetical protein
MSDVDRLLATDRGTVLDPGNPATWTAAYVANRYAGMHETWVRELLTGYGIPAARAARWARTAANRPANYRELTQPETPQAYRVISPAGAVVAVVHRKDAN